MLPDHKTACICGTPTNSRSLRCITPRSGRTLSGGTRFGRGQLTRIPLLEPCRSPPGSSCRQLATMSSDSLTMPWPAAAAMRQARGAPRRVGDRGLPERMAGASNYRDLDAVSAGCMPRVMVLPHIRSCLTKRCRAATMLPHSNPHPNLRLVRTLKVKTSLRQNKTLRSVKPGHKGKPLSPAVRSFSS